jgi:transaldolase
MVKPFKNSLGFKATLMTNKLEQLKQFTTVVADTGDIKSIKQYSPQDATTNPSLIYKAAQMPEYQDLINDAITYAQKQFQNQAQTKTKILDLAMDKLAVNFGCEILKLIPGRVSTEVDARLSFDTEKTIQKARELIKLYKNQNIDSNRILIKIAATYEGIMAAKVLEQENIHCNLTLMFDISQAILCAESGVTLISPFVGRILDWYKAKTGEAYTAQTDPGVLSVQAIYHYFRKFDYKTVVMGASFRNTGEIEALAGCDFLTISPNLLEQLQTDNSNLTRILDPQTSKTQTIPSIKFNESTFRLAMNNNPMATEKLAEGIRGFTADLIKLEQDLEPKLAKK